MAIIKKYKLFLESKSYNNRFKFEENVIDPILTIIRDNQEDEGKKRLYAHDFMLWLKNNQNNFK